MYKYEHGGNERFKNKDIIDFSANINPLGIKKDALKVLENSFKTSSLYPDNFSTKLREKISLYENIDSKNIFCSNGASDIIFRSVLYLKPKSALVLAPTFSDYERALNTVNTKIYKYNLKKEKDFNLDEHILYTIENNNFDMIFLCSPNNPTGQIIEKNLLEKILYICKTKNTFVFIDECFLDFLENKEDYTAKYFMNSYKNFCILKAFTKMFAMAGFRLGYCICPSEEFINNLYSYGADWAVSVFAQDMGVYVLENSKDYIKNSIEYINKEKANIINSLEALDFKIIGSKANYIFFKAYEDFDKILYKKYNICIRNCSNYSNLNDEYFRLGISTKENNQKLKDALEEIRKKVIK